MDKKRKLELNSAVKPAKASPSTTKVSSAVAPPEAAMAKLPQWAGGEKEVKEEVEEEANVKEEVEEKEGDGESDPASIQALLDSFPKDQLVILLRDAAVAHGGVLTAIHHVADADPAQRKIFVHGLGWDATTDTLSEAFGQYGEIEDLRVVTDRNTGKCKGYGFIHFRHCSGARAALREPQKMIGSRSTACQLASVGPVNGAARVPAQMQMPPVSEYTQRKIFVGNVSADIDPTQLFQFFARYGEIEQGPLGLDMVTGKPKGFAIFVYKTIESANKAVQEPHKPFDGVMLYCQKAIDGPKVNKLGGSGASSGGNAFAAGYGATSSHSLPGTVGMIQPMSVLSAVLAYQQYGLNSLF